MWMTSDTAVGTITENDTDLVVTKTVDNGTPDEGDTITFTVTVTNSGSIQVTNVSLDDVLPAGLTAGTITPSQGSYTRSDMDHRNHRQWRKRYIND